MTSNGNDLMSYGKRMDIGNQDDDFDEDIDDQDFGNQDDESSFGNDLSSDNDSGVGEDLDNHSDISSIGENEDDEDDFKEPIKNQKKIAQEEGKKVTLNFYAAYSLRDLQKHNLVPMEMLPSSKKILESHPDHLISTPTVVGTCRNVSPISTITHACKKNEKSYEKIDKEAPGFYLLPEEEQVNPNFRLCELDNTPKSEVFKNVYSENDLNMQYGTEIQRNKKGERKTELVEGKSVEMTNTIIPIDDPMGEIIKTIVKKNDFGIERKGYNWHMNTSEFLKMKAQIVNGWKEQTQRCVPLQNFALAIEPAQSGANSISNNAESKTTSSELSKSVFRVSARTQPIQPTPQAPRRFSLLGSKELKARSIKQDFDLNDPNILDELHEAYCSVEVKLIPTKSKQ